MWVPFFRPIDRIIVLNWYTITFDGLVGVIGEDLRVRFLVQRMSIMDDRVVC